MDSSARPTALKVRPENIPDELKELPRWVGWKYALQDGKWKKPPVDCRNGRPASVKDSSTWASFDVALKAYEERGLDGIGLVLAGDGFVGIDLDDCVDLLTKTVADATQATFKRFLSYSELSPSGKGIHIFVRGALPGNAKRGGEEVYAADHYLTVTGRSVNSTHMAVRPAQAELLDYYYRLRTEPPALTDDQILEFAPKAGAGNGAKFKALWEGDVSGYDSHSEADVALCAILAFWTQGEAARIEKLFGQSGLAERNKWTKREDYRDRTIRAALSGPLGFYQKSGRTSLLPSEPKITQLIQDNPVNTDINTAREVFHPAWVGEQERVRGRVLELAREDRKLPTWKATFNLSRWLKHFADDRPEQFKEEVITYCTEAGREFEEFYLDFLVGFPKVHTKEGDGALGWAKTQAETHPYTPPCSISPLYDKLAGMAWHLSKLNKGNPFVFPQPQLAQTLGSNKMKVNRAVKLLVRDKLIFCVKPEYSYVNGEAREYIFTGPEPQPNQGTAA
jgi:putative DNA primase/helicase